MTRIDVSTRADVIHYLRSIQVNPKGAVIQRGLRNYAGAHCPGKHWTCAGTRHTVVQIAKRGGQNRFVCKSSKCVVVQISGASHGVYVSGRRLASTAAPTAGGSSGVCLKSGSGSPNAMGQTCTINQSGSGPNTAVVWENSQKVAGLTTSLAFTATITQTATGGGLTQGNTACVTQNINLDGSTTGLKGKPVTVNLQARQSVIITQNASGSGPNTATKAAVLSGTTATCGTDTLGQSQTLTSTANGTAGITQNQNAPDSGPNISLDIKQNQSPGYLTVSSGLNKADFSQTNTLSAIANTPVGPVTQTQSSPTGGIQANVSQDSTGLSTVNATQTETQCEDAAASGLTACSTTAQDPPSYTLTQTQYGPVRKDPGSAQTGNDDDTFAVTQVSNQYNDTGQNQKNVVQGACTTSGNCTVNQNTNGTPNVQSGSNVDAQTTCIGNSCFAISPTGFSGTNTDVAEFGVGGMRGTGTGSITTSGITGPVRHALLYWHGPTNSADPASNASVTFNGSSITGTNIGTASDNNWSFTNSQAYRADVTSLVTGNATYSLSDFVKAGGIDINGVALIVLYDDGNSSNNRNVLAWNGNDSNIAFGSDPADWNETISGVQYPGSGSASLDFVVSDGQSYNDADVVLSVNGNTGVPVASGPSVFQGDSGPNYSGNPFPVTGSLWDVKPFDITSLLASGSNTLNLTSGTANDALSLVVAIANVPAS